LFSKAIAQSNLTAPAKVGISSLPGRGLMQHDFLYTGEAERRRPVQTVYLVHKGAVVWSYEIQTKYPDGEEGELGVATMHPNGNIVFCRRTGATEVTPDKKIVWNYDAPKGTEVHAVEAVGENHVLMVLNGVPARAMLINIQTGKTESECILPTGKLNPHLQFRRVILTPDGTYLAAHLDSNTVAEYDTKGKLLWNYTIKKPWCAARLKNGNTLITSNYDNKGYIVEVNKKGKVVWDLSQADIPNIKLYQLQVAVRLDNGNTIFSNWCVNGIKDPQDWPNSVQLIEVTPNKKVVWALSQWANPDIGPASSIQILDNMDLNKIKAYRLKK
jgi:outer membrane protein assembly factor BamB